MLTTLINHSVGLDQSDSSGGGEKWCCSLQYEKRAARMCQWIECGCKTYCEVRMIPRFEGILKHGVGIN